MTWKDTDILDWLLTDGRFLPDLDAATKALGKEMLDIGVPIWRFRLAIRTIHPLVAASSAIWERDSGSIEPQEASHGLEKRNDYIGSPMAVIRETSQPLRQSLISLSPTDHDAFHELHARGASDYYGVPLRFSGKGGGIAVFVTDRASGFSETDIAAFNRIALGLTPIVEVYRLNYLSSAIAEAYLGHRSGQRVLGGEITRGHVEQLDAAVFFSDLRNWTGLSSTLPAAEALSLANRYFELMDQAVTAHGGEILKFMGDGVLAIFSESELGERTCINALAAAHAAHEMARKADHPIATDFGVGLHHGRVSYGNVGSERRLDFTVMGQAVNVAARVEALCPRFSQPVLCSKALADRLPNSNDVLDTVTLKGLSAPQEIFAP